MLTIFVRTLLIYGSLLLTLRVMGKRQIGELEVTDLVTTLLISEIASLPITNQDIPVSYALIPIVTLLILEIFFSVILIRFPRLKGLVSAKPTVIIRHGVLCQRALSDLRVSVEELMSEIRQQGYPDLSMISDAILEKNGKLTVMPKPQFAPPNLGQLGIKVLKDPLMHVVLSGGTYNDAGLRLIGYDRAWLDAQLARRGYARDSLFCVTANEKGQLLLIPNTDKRACEATGGRV